MSQNPIGQAYLVVNFIDLSLRIFCQFVSYSLMRPADGFEGTARFKQGVRGLLPLLLADHLGIPSVDLSSTTRGGRGA